jgi:hypothetical protein
MGFEFLASALMLVDYEFVCHSQTAMKVETLQFSVDILMPCKTNKRLSVNIDFRKFRR